MCKNEINLNNKDSYKILIIGLNKSGKTTIINYLNNYNLKKKLNKNKVYTFGKQINNFKIYNKNVEIIELNWDFKYMINSIENLDLIILVIDIRTASNNINLFKDLYNQINNKFYFIFNYYDLVENPKLHIKSFKDIINICEIHFEYLILNNNKENNINKNTFLNFIYNKLYVKKFKKICCFKIFN